MRLRVRPTGTIGAPAPLKILKPTEPLKLLSVLEFGHDFALCRLKYRKQQSLL
jgi:hypothetical protein